MSTGEIRKVSREDIQLVQNLIERCLQLYMSQKEVVDTLLVQAKIEPGFTELVWQKLEEENREFFKAYHLRLIVKDQIMQFNQLLERQVELMHISTGVASTPISNGSHIPPLHQNSTGYPLDHTGPGLKSETMGHPMGSSLPNAYNNGGSSLHPCMQNAVDMLTHSRRIDVSPSMMVAHGSNVGMMQGMNGGLIKSESGCYGGNSRYMFDNGGDVLETRPAIGNPSVSPFSSVDSNSHPLNESLLDADGTSFGLLQIPRNFSLSDLTADFSNGSDILLDYSRSPFLAGDSGNFLDPHGRGEYQGDNKRLDTISEGLSYEDFGSD